VWWQVEMPLFQTTKSANCRCLRAAVDRQEDYYRSSLFEMRQGIRVHWAGQQDLFKLCQSQWEKYGDAEAAFRK
jgi:hypothetical protein